MLVHRLVLVVAPLAAILALTATDPARAGGRSVVDRSQVELSGDGTVVGGLAVKAVRKKDGTLKRATLRLSANGLARRARYRVLVDDPTDARGDALHVVGDARTSSSGRLSIRFGSRRHPLPFDADPADLAGARIELRDDAGATVLTAAMPTLEHRGPLASHAPGEDHDCAFRDVIVTADDFSGDTAATAPAAWTVAGTDATAGRTILVDDAVSDGAEGLTTRITDTDTTTTAGPTMVLPFIAQTGRMAVEFTLIPADGASRVVAQLGGYDGSTFTPAGALVVGAGLHEDGQVGLGGVADFGSYSAGTAVTFRIDADVTSDTFGLSIDGVVVASGITLDLATPGLSAIDAVRFTTGDSVTGTANVDAVTVLDVEDDCAPTADAGADIVVECAGASTPVQLDGSDSSDPEDEDLTYAWSGLFTEETATGAMPTVNFTALGDFDVTLVVNDGIQDSDADTVQVTVVDTTPPRIAAPDDVTMECTGPGSQVRLGTPLVVDICDPDPTVENDSPRAFRVGETTVTWTATDASGNSAADTQVVTITDTTAPTIRVGGLPTELWPPNHNLVQIRPRIVAEDLCDPHPEVTVRISSSEDDDSQTGDGSTTGDIVINSAYDIELRAERKGNGSGRTYTLVWTVTDANGNAASTEPMTITVPHSQGSGNGKSKSKNK